jgi:hypothetical protein
MSKYEVIESKVWLRDDGKRASIYGALPWNSEAEKARWQMVSQGWTVRNPFTGEVGVGRPPSATKELAQALADKLGRPSSISFGY